MEKTMSNDFEIKIGLRNLAYYCLCIFSVIFIIPENNEFQVGRVYLILGILGGLIVFLEKLFWKFRRGIKINKFIRILNSFVVIMYMKYTCPILGGINLLLGFLTMKKVNPLYILGLSIIVIYACYSLIKFIKTNPYDNKRDSKC